MFALRPEADIWAILRDICFVPRDVILLNRQRSTAIDLRDNFPGPRSRVTIAGVAMSDRSDGLSQALGFGPRYCKSVVGDVDVYEPQY